MTPELELVEELGRYSSDPLSFVRWAFPWSEPGTELADETGPDEWQISVLADMRDGLLTPNEAIQVAISSGHGVGKSALVAWIIIWAISTFEDCRGVITANTENQLKTKTWAELGKWHRLFIGSSLFELTATAIFSTEPGHTRTWRIDLVPWSEKNMEAFAGLHNKNKRVLLVFDEASAIPNAIWETAEGALTDADTQILWLVCGNPTMNTGRFREVLPGGRFSHRWHSHKVDSRTAKHTNKAQIQQWMEDYGEDSDFFRVRVKGEPPRAGSLQFFPGDLIDAARSSTRDAHVGLYDPFIMGVDVARFGDDKSVIRFRRGRDARSIKPIKYRGMDTQTLALRVVELYTLHRPDAIFVDGGGVGAGVVDRLRELRCPVIEVQFGAKADRSMIGQDDAFIYANKRAEMCGALREWLKGGMIDDDPELIADLTGIQYGFAQRDGREAVILEKKDDAKRRGLASPDDADALALTFAYPVMPSDHTRVLQARPVHQIEFFPFKAAQEVVRHGGPI